MSSLAFLFLAFSHGGGESLPDEKPVFDDYTRSSQISLAPGSDSLILFSLGGTIPELLRMQPSRIFETVLYAEDLAAAERFYHEALGLDVIGRGELSAVFRCGGGVLLVFDPRKSAAPDRDVPSHGTTGAGHVAFAVKPEDLATWREQLRQAGVSIEREVDWDEGGCSIYFRDPAGNLVELAPPTIWGGGWKF